MRTQARLVEGSAVGAQSEHKPAYADMSAEELVSYLQGHPDKAAEFELLLYLPSLSGRELVFVRALARFDATLVRRALAGMQPGGASLSRIKDGIAELDAVNARAVDGGVFTRGQAAYLEAWYDELGSENLAALPRYLSDAIRNDTLLGVVRADEETFDRLRNEYLKPIADGIMNLSNPKVVYGLESRRRIRLDDMPDAVQDLVRSETRIRVPRRRNGIRLRGPRQGPGNNGCQSLVFPGEQDLAIDIAGLADFIGFADLLSAATVLSGDVFAAELWAAAVRVKQGLNLVDNHASDLHVRSTDLWDWWDWRVWDNGSAEAPRTPTPWEQLNTLLHQSEIGISTILSVVGRNNDACAALLLDPEDRAIVLGEPWGRVDSLPILLGFDWAEDTGAASIILAGTDRFPSGGHGGTALQAQAAVALFQEVGGDRDGYLEWMTEAVQHAVVAAGVRWIDAFAAGPAAEGASGVDPEFIDPLERSYLGVALDEEDQRNFLEFVAGTGSAREESGALAFAAAAYAYSQKLLTQAMETNKAVHVNGALKWAARLDGSVTAANYEYKLDATHDWYGRETAAYEADRNRRKGTAAGIKTAAGVGLAFLAFQAVATNTAPVLMPVMGSGIAHGGLPLIDQLVGMPEPPEYVVPADAKELFDSDRLNSSPERAYLILAAANQAGIDPMDVDARNLRKFLYQQDKFGVIRLDARERPVLRHYDDLIDDGIAASTNLTLLGNACDGAIQAWQRRVEELNRRHGLNNSATINVAHYDTMWAHYANGSYGRPSPKRSPWRDSKQAKRMLYGEPV